MKEELKAFQDKLEADEALNARFNDICELQDMVEVRARTIELAREAGIELTEADLVPASVLEEEELAGVAGGCFLGERAARPLFF